MGKTNFKAQSLVEIIIGIGVLGIVFVSVLNLVTVAIRAAKISRERSLAQSLINDMGTSVKSLINYDWHALWSQTGGISYWSLDDGPDSLSSNNIAIDEIYGNNAKINLGSSGNTSLANAWVASSTCKSGSCLSLDGTDDWADAGAASNIDLSGDLSFSFWVNPSSISANRNILGKSSLHDFNTRMNSDRSFTYLHGNGSSSYSCTVNSVFSTSTWAFISVVRSNAGQSVSIYKDGALQSASCNSWVAVASSSNNLRIGYVGDGYFPGKVDELRVYNVALSAGEVASLYSGINQYYPYNNSGVWQIKHGQQSVTLSSISFTRYFSISSVTRASSTNDIVSSGGDNDPFTKKISMVVSWSGNNSISQDQYISRTSLANIFYQTDWSQGATSTEIIFVPPTNFYTASSAIIYATSGEITLNLGIALSGTVSSMVFDTQTIKGVAPIALIWQGSLGSGNTVKFQLAGFNVATTSSSSMNFIGSDGTSASFFPNSGSSQPNVQLDVSLAQLFNQRFFALKAFLTGSSTAPTIQDISLVFNN